MPQSVLVGYWEWNRLESFELCHLEVFVGKGEQKCLHHLYSISCSCQYWSSLWGKKHACPFFFSFFPPLSNQGFAYAHGNWVVSCFGFCWRLVSILRCCPACLELSDGLHRRSVQAYPEILLGSPALSDGALFPQRPKLVCFREVIFRSCCLAGGKTFFLNRRADCNRIPLFPDCLLPFSTIFFPFFCVTQFPIHCRLLTHVCTSSLLFHFLYLCSYCARIW